VPEEYRIFETTRFIRMLEAVNPPFIREAITGKLHFYLYPRLKVNPFRGPNIRKLKSSGMDMWRYRMGRWRLFYTVDAERVVSILEIEDRKDAY